MSQKYLTIRKSKVTLRLNKPVYVAMCMLNLSKELMFHYNTSSFMITLKVVMVTTQKVMITFY